MATPRRTRAWRTSLGFLKPDQLLAVAEAVLTTQRDFGNRAVRKRARLKYTIEDRGLDWFVAEITRRQGFALEPARPFKFTATGDRFGWTEGFDGRWHLTLRIDAGRIADTARGPLAHGPARDRQGSPRRLPPDAEPESDRSPTSMPSRARSSTGSSCATASTGTRVQRRLRSTRLRAWRCRPARSRWPRPSATCRASRSWSTNVSPRMAWPGAPLVLRITGCPNGCARPYLAEVALVGKAPGRYNLFLGGDGRGQRLNALYLENVDEPTIVAALDAAFAPLRPGAHRGRALRRLRVARGPGRGQGGMSRGGVARMRALAWNPALAMHEPAVLDEMNCDLERMNAAEPRALGGREPARRARAVVELRRAGGGLAAPGHASTAVAAGRADRHRLPVPGDVSIHRRPRREARPEPQGVPAAACRRPGSRRGTAGSGSRASKASIATTNCARPSRCSARCANWACNTWFAGLRRDQAETRRRIRPLEWRDGRWKVHPIFDWSDRQIFDYLRRHDLPYHPLWHEGYVSIGDWHTTRTLAEAGDAEATRFFGLKRECGLHGLDG